MPLMNLFHQIAQIPDNRKTTKETRNCIIVKHSPTFISIHAYEILSFRLAKQRFSDISHDAQPKLHDEKLRSESLPSPEHSLRPYHYTGAISKIKTIEPRDASSQDSGINLSFHDSSDERKKLRNSLER